MDRFGKSLAKAGLFIVAFVPIHYLYDWFPSPVTAFFSESGGESVFQHMKLGFWAWIVASAAEYLLWMRREPRKAAFLESRGLGAVMIPYLQTLVWYLAPATVGAIRSVAAEVAWSFAACFAAGLGMSVLEWDFENAPSTLSRKVCVWALVGLTLFMFSRFTYGPLPWIDVFAAP